MTVVCDDAIVRLCVSCSEFLFEEAGESREGTRVVQNKGVVEFASGVNGPALQSGRFLRLRTLSGSLRSEARIAGAHGQFLRRGYVGTWGSSSDKHTPVVSSYLGT